jgi:hypothetical protein
MVKGVTGMGLPTVAMGVLGAVMSPLTAAAILIIPSFVTNVWQMLAGRDTLRLMRRLWAMMLCIVIGTLLGTRLLVIVDPVWSGRALGLGLIAYAAYALFLPTLSVPARLESWLSPVIGIVTGLLTGATGLFTIPAVPYVQSLGLQKDELVQALGLSFTVSTVALAGGLLVHDAFRLDQLGLSLLAVIPALAGMWSGSIVRQKISPKIFRRCFLLLLIILGSELAFRPSLERKLAKPAESTSPAASEAPRNAGSLAFHPLPKTICLTRQCGSVSYVPSRLAEPSLENDHHHWPAGGPLRVRCAMASGLGSIRGARNSLPRCAQGPGDH